MEHLSSILWILSWPLVIFISYKLCVYLVRVYEKNLPEEERTEGL